MGFDREYYVNTREGFTSLWRIYEEKEGKILFSRRYTVASDGEYFLQYFTDKNDRIEVVSPKSRYTPILHGEDPEIVLYLKKGENESVVSIPTENGTVPTL